MVQAFGLRGADELTALDVILRRASALTLKSPGPSPEHVRTILHAGTRAPDHGKLEPWRFIVIDGEARGRLGEVLATSLRRRHPDAEDVELRREREKPFRAPTIIAVAAHPIEGRIPRVEQMYATAAAAQNMILAAVALGYGTMWKTGAPAYDARVKEFLGLEPSDEIIGFLYLGTADLVPKRERMTRLDEFVRWL